MAFPCRQYDPASDKWAQQSFFSSGYRFLGAAFAIFNKGFYVTGSDSTGLVNDLWQFSPQKQFSMRSFPVAGQFLPLNNKGKRSDLNR